MAKRKKKSMPSRFRTGNRMMDATKEYLYKRIDQITPNVYSAFALVLATNYGWEPEQIATLFAETQSLWADSLDDGRDMTQICLDELGIDVRAGAEQGIEGGEDFLVDREESED